MSSILKALKKLENEKAVRKPDSIKINNEILREGSSSQSLVKTFVVVFCVFLGGAGTVYFVMKPAVETTAVRSDKNSNPAPPTTVVTDNLKQEKKDVLRAENVASPHSIVPHKPAVKLSQAVPVKVQKKAELLMSRPNVVKSFSPPLAPSQKTIPGTQVPSLKVNGIAFQEETADRVAIVNGISVSNGSVIEGVRVDDIQKDRVKFSHGGNKFEIALGKSN